MLSESNKVLINMCLNKFVQKMLNLKNLCNSKMQNYESSEESVQEIKLVHK